MDALKIALETVFVGALALPWLALALQLFFPEFSLFKTETFDGWGKSVWLIKSEVVGYTVVGVLALAMAYTFGAALSRLAQDFFNDDDLLFHVPTEDQIRASVYCNPLESILVELRVPSQENSKTCEQITPGWPRGVRTRYAKPTLDQARQIFTLQETALLLQGEDKVSRLRLLHQQIMVLRGAAFNGLIAWVLCLLGWNAKHRWGPWRWGLWRSLLPIALLFYALYGFGNHFELFHGSQPFQLKLDDPPFTELTLLLLAVGGCYVVWRDTEGSWPRGTGWVSLLLAALAYSGWYWTEILYNRLVIFSYYAGQHQLLRLSQ